MNFFLRHGLTRVGTHYQVRHDGVKVRSGEGEYQVIRASGDREADDGEHEEGRIQKTGGGMTEGGVEMGDPFGP